MSEDFNEVVEAIETPVLEVKIGDWLKEAWELYTKDWMKYSVSVLIAIAISAFTCGILLAPMLVGLYSCFFKKMRGEDFEYGDLFYGVKNQFLPSFLIAIALMVVNVILNLIPCIGPLLSLAFILIAMPVFSYSLFMMSQASETYKVDSLIDLVKEVYEKIKPQYFMFVLWLLIVGAIGGIGGIICGVGVLFTYPIAILALSVSYSEIFGGCKNEDVVVEAEPVNEETV